jgi:Bax protein
MNPNEPRIPAKVRREDRQVFLKRYPDISASIRDYFQTVGKVNAYREFRQARLRSTDYRELIPFLKYYSERGMKYVDDLERMIRLNDFEQYDQYQLDPFYLNID